MIAMLLQIVERSEVCDPARHEWTVLAGFLESITDSESLNIVDRHVKWERQAQAVRKFYARCHLSLSQPASQPASQPWLLRASMGVSVTSLGLLY